jgi:DNA-binding transcriptional LysR family regulator
LFRRAHHRFHAARKIAAEYEIIVSKKRKMDTLAHHFPALVAFARIVAAGSLSAAARELDVPVSVVSKRLSLLETHLGTRLLQRTTRRQTLTEEGHLFHARVLRILDEVEQAEALLAQRRDGVHGLLRITAPGELGRRWLAPIAAAFQELHPQVTIQLELTDTVVDLLDGGHDLGVRYGALADSSLVARALAPNYRVLCASPAYLQRHGEPRTPAELAGHRCIVIGDQRRTDWKFDGDETATVRVDAAFLTNDGGAAQQLALAGSGIALKSIWDVGDDLDAGRLVRVLPHHAMAAAPLHAVYPHQKNLAPRVRLFVGFVKERLQAAWRW